MIASHQGLQSLGRVLTIGVTCCLFTSLVMLPALMTWFTRHRVDEPAVVPPIRPGSPSCGTTGRRYDPRQNVPVSPHASPVHRPEDR